MAYTVPAKIAAHQALLDLLATGSNDAVLRLMGGSTTLADLPIDDTASEVSAVTGELTLAHGDPGTATASGTVTKAQLIARDGTVLENNIPVQQGASPVVGYVVLSSLSLISGAEVSLVSCVIG